MYDQQIETFYKFLIIKSLLLLVVITGVLGRLTQTPKNNIVLEGATVEFSCCSNVQKLFFWKVKPIGSQSTNDIYDTYGLINGFRKSGQFNVTDGSSPGCDRLTITDVKRENAGTYSCIDNEGLGQKISWELVILESFHCEEIDRESEYMGENSFDLPQDVISAFCISKYFGNVPPKPICEWSSGTKLFANYHRFTESPLTITLNIQMPARKELYGDQLSCYLKIDGESSNNKTATAWKSSHLKLNYASFHQKGVPQCSVDELSLDCHPPCDYKVLRFSNGLFYCEIAYPSHTHKKVYVLLQDTNLQQTTFISRTTGMPAESQAQSSENHQRRYSDMPEKIELNPNRNKGRHTISKPGIVINMGDGNNVTVNTVYGNQRNTVTMKQENKPLLKEVEAKELSRKSATPNSEPENVAIRGVAVLGEQLFLAYRNSSQVRVYSANTLGYQQSWELKELNRFEDMTACSRHSCLYMSNIKLKGNECEIFKVSPKGMLITKWETGTNYGRLSVTHDFNVLLAVHFNRKLVEYMPDGTLLKEIQLPNALHPMYALKVHSDDYYVSHGCVDDPLHGVSKVDAYGTVLKTFGGTKGSTSDQLDTPVHLAMNDGSIWVADSRNGRVVVLSSTLEYQATLLSKEEDELNRPLRICLDQANHRLLLSDFQNQNHFLRVYNLT